jgi:hypothetical protein
MSPPKKCLPELARRSGFLGVVDLLKEAKHGPGENVYLIDFEYHADATTAGVEAVCGSDRSPVRSIVSNRYQFSQLLKFRYRWNFQQGQGYNRC